MNGGRCRINALPFTPFGQLRTGFDKPVLSESFGLRQAQTERRVEACGEPVEPGSGRTALIKSFPNDVILSLNRAWHRGRVAHIRGATGRPDFYQP